MFKKLNLSPTEYNNPTTLPTTYNSTAPTFNSSTPNSRLVPGPPPGITNTMSPGYHAVSGDYHNQYKKQQKDHSYRESDTSVYSTYDFRESLVDPKNERVVGISRETYIEPQTSTLVHTQVTPQSIYGVQSLNPHDGSRTSYAPSLAPSLAHMSFFNDGSSDSLHSEIRNLRPESIITKHQPRVQQAESPVKMKHAYVEVPLPSAAVIEQISADNTASVYMDDNNRASNVSGYTFDTPTAAQHQQQQQQQPKSTSTYINNNVDSYYHDGTDNNNNYLKPTSSSQQQQQQLHSSRQHPQPLAPLVIPSTPSRSMTSPHSQQVQEQRDLSNQAGYYQSSLVQSTATQQQLHEQQGYYQPPMTTYSNNSTPTSAARSPQQQQQQQQNDGLQQPQLTPGTQSGGSPYSVSPRTPSPNTLLPPQQPYATSYSPSSPTSSYNQPPLSPCLPPPSAHPGLSEKLSKQIRHSIEWSSKNRPQSEGEGLVAQGIQYHEQGRLDLATDCFRQAANKDSPIGMFLFGVSLRHGWGCKRNEQTAFQYLQKAAEHAVMDLKNLSSTVNTSAAKSELVMAIYELGNSYLHGWGTRKNKETAVHFFKLAADLGDPDAQNELATAYYRGKGVKKDLYQAAKYYRMADKQGCGIMGNSWIYKSKYDKVEKS